MQKAIGLILLGSGLVYAAYSNSTSSLDREEQIAAVTRIVAQGVIIEPATVAAEQPGLRQPVTPSASAVSAFAAPELATAAVPRPETVVGPPLTVDPPTGAWETRLDPVTIPAREVVPASPAAVQKTQRQLARQIQSELKRVGCYAGRLDGSWGDQSRAAMTAFIARVNASLPTREPDVILLSLIKGQTGEVCGAACRPGDVAAAGRCAPRTVLAAADAIPAAAPIEAPAPLAVPLPGRMSVGGPRTGPGPVVAAAPVTDWPSPAGERLPWRENPADRAAGRPVGTGSTTVARLDSDDPAAAGEREPAAALAAPDGADAAAIQDAPARKGAKAYRVRAGVATRDAGPRQVRKRRYATRSVQQLFLHPLGRM